MSARLDEADRETYAGLADALLPAYGRFPAATTAEVAGERLDRILTWRPDLFADLRRAIAAARGAAPDEAIAALQREDPDAFTAIRLAVLGAYYLDPGVRAALGYDGQPSRPIAEDEIPDYLAPGLLEPVLQRGPCWRPVKKQPPEKKEQAS